MSITYNENTRTSTAEIVVDGNVAEEEFQNIIPNLEAFTEKNGKIKVIEIIKDFDGADLSILREGIKFDTKYTKNFSHCAIVSDSGWIGPFATFFGNLVSCEVRSFELDDEDAARAWLEAA